MTRCWCEAGSGVDTQDQANSRGGKRLTVRLHPLYRYFVRAAAALLVPILVHTFVLWLLLA